MYDEALTYNRTDGEGHFVETVYVGACVKDCGDGFMENQYFDYG